MIYNVICFVARKSGLHCLKELNTHANFKVVAVFTHKKRPSTEDPKRRDRSDFIKFLDYCSLHNIPIFVKDSFREAESIDEVNFFLPVDFIFSCSWRFLIPLNILKKASKGTLNLHRGKLPDYAGAEPILRAIKDKRKLIWLTAHKMNEEYDSGQIIQEISLEVHPFRQKTDEETADRLKNEFLPYYPKIMIESLNKLLEEEK